MGVMQYESHGRTLWKISTWVRDGSGVPRRVSKRGIPTRQLAVAFESKVRAEAFEDRWFDRPKASKLTVRGAWEAYEPVSKRTKRSWRTDRCRAEPVLRHLGSRRAESLTQKDVDRYREARFGEVTRRGVPPMIATVNREVAHLKRILSYAVECGDLKANPLTRVGLLHEDNVRQVVVSEEEFARLMAHAEPELLALLVLAFDTGIRRREALALTWRQVNLQQGTILIPPSDNKGHRPRTVFLTDRAREALKAMPRAISGHVFVNPATNKPWVDLRKMYRRAMDAAGLEGIWYTDLRRSFVTHARRRGVQESVVMAMSGHRTREVFDRYNVISSEDLEEAVRMIERGREKDLQREDRSATPSERETK
jgi:integrase